MDGSGDDEAPATENRRPGRPLDTSLDARVLDATRQSLTELGWSGTTVRGIAARSGVSRPAIARRWPSKSRLVLAAILGETPDLEPFAGIQDRQDWVDAVVTGSFDLFARPDVIAAVPGLLSELAADDGVRDVLWHSFSGAASELLVRSDGEAPDAADAVDARAMIAVAAGAAMFASLIVGADDSAVAARIRELTLALAPGAGVRWRSHPTDQLN